MNIQPDLFSPVWYTQQTLAQALGISIATLLRYIKRGRVPPPQRWGYRTVRWHKDEVAHQVRFGPSPVGTYTSTPQPPALPSTDTQGQSARKPKGTGGPKDGARKGRNGRKARAG